MDRDEIERSQPAPDDLVSVEEAAAVLDRSPRTVWDLARDHNVPRYRVAARGKVTLLRWGDVYDAYHAPRKIVRRAKKAIACPSRRSLGNPSPAGLAVG